MNTMMKDIYLAVFRDKCKVEFLGGLSYRITKYYKNGNSYVIINKKKVKLI